MTGWMVRVKIDDHFERWDGGVGGQDILQKKGNSINVERNGF